MIDADPQTGITTGNHLIDNQIGIPDIVDDKIMNHKCPVGDDAKIIGRLIHLDTRGCQNIVADHQQAEE